ncbi:MAG TPA: acylneuraminate cytidylyltransferase family protein [Vicinamibacterales bacterium]|jgi:CMP-N-acetylneuraminic acid synthetase|nr:acylneuraminate cytidylyltransferase family protein [Vicinamibacterales bacterium]
MPEQHNVVAIIPARGGSRGLPRKNIRLLAGKPLIAYSIEAAKASPMVDRTLVSTDDAEIAEVARQWGAEVPFLRPAELAQDHTPTEPVLQHAVEWLEQIDHYRVDIVVYLQPTDIFRKRTMIDEAVRRLLNDPELDTAFVAYSTHKNFWRKVEGRYVRLAPDIKPGPRQTREPVYREDTGLACASRGAVIKAGRRIGDRVAVIPTDDDLSSIDIHTEFDLWLAEQVLTEGGRQVND